MLQKGEPMSDLISRQAAIEVADAVWSVTGDKNVAKVWDQIKDLPSAQPGEDIRAMCGECDAWNQYKNYPQPGWIPCSTELPKEDGRYLVSVRILHEYNKVMISRFDNGEFWDSDVVAWMPLPKPYREGGQDGKD